MRPLFAGSSQEVNTVDSLRSAPLVLLRIIIGWHFLYEGLTKLLYPGWTSAGYLKGSTGPLAPIFMGVWQSWQPDVVTR